MRNKNLITPTQLREYLGGISRPTLWRLCKDNKLPQPKRLSGKLLYWDIKEGNKAVGFEPKRNSKQVGTPKG